MAEQREPNWSSGMKKDDAGRYVHGACRIDGDGFCVTHQSANWAECANAKMPPPSAAPSQPPENAKGMPDYVPCPKTGNDQCYFGYCRKASGCYLRDFDVKSVTAAAPSQPQQQDMVAETVLDPEPGQPSNPAVARKSERRLVVDTANYWYKGSRDESYSFAERLLFMENALNHTENALIVTLEEPAGEWATKCRAELAKRREPLTRPTNERHRR